MKNAKTTKTVKNHKQAPKSIDTGRHVIKAKTQAPKNGAVKATRRDKIDREAAKKVAIDIAQTIGLIIDDAKQALKAVQAKKFLDATADMSRVEDNSDYILGELEVIDA